jgi:hypothetical protein
VSGDVISLFVILVPERPLPSVPQSDAAHPTFPSVLDSFQGPIAIGISFTMYDYSKMFVDRYF